MAEYKIALSLGLALILTAACERPSAVAQKDDAPPASEARQFAAAPSTPRQAEEGRVSESEEPDAPRRGPAAD